MLDAKGYLRSKFVHSDCTDTIHIVCFWFQTRYVDTYEGLHGTHFENHRVGVSQIGLLEHLTSNKNIDKQAEAIDKPLSFAKRRHCRRSQAGHCCGCNSLWKSTSVSLTNGQMLNSIKTSSGCTDPANPNHSSTLPEVRRSSYQALLALNRNVAVATQRKPRRRSHARGVSLLCTSIVTHMEDAVITNPFRGDECSYTIHTSERNLFIQ